MPESRGSPALKLGVRIDNAWTTAQQLEYALTAERLGFDTVWAEGNPFKREPFSMLGVLAQQTTHVQLGLAVASVYFVHPLLMASAAVTVDELSGGRMRLGVGCSSTHALAPVGLRQVKPVATVREAMEVIRALLRAEPVTYRGERYQLDDAHLVGATGRRIPVLAAAEGPRMQTMVGSASDGLIFPVANRSYNRLTLENVRRGLATAGRCRSDFTVVAYARLWTTEDETEDRELLRRLAARLIYRLSRGAWEQMGLDSATANAYMKHPEHIPDALFRQLIVAGDAPTVATGVRDLFDQGMDEVVLDFPTLHGQPENEQYARYLHLMQAFGHQVLPQLRRAPAGSSG